MSNATILLARRSIRARIGRLIAIAIAIVLGVSFVVGSFVLADSLRRGFDALFTEISEYTDLQVRTSLVFGEATDLNQRDPLPEGVLEQVESVDGVEHAEGSVQRFAQLIGSDGDVVETGGAPTYGISWNGPDPRDAIRLLDGQAPAGRDEVAIDKATADDRGFAVGEPIGIVTITGRHTFTLVGLIGLGTSDGFAGATVALFDPATAATVLGAEGVYDTIEVQVAPGAVAGVQQELRQILGGDVEVVDRDTLVQEANDQVNSFIGPFSTGLLVFAFITAFVSAFLINNVFAITIGQRLRELALLRAVGGAGRQVRRLIIVEALLMSLVATVVGIGGGLLVAKGLIAIFNAAGTGFPDMALVLAPRSVIVAFAVGVGITLAAVTIPARRAARIPPVAAMRPELGFESLSARRLVVGTVVVAIGAVMFVVGLFARPGGTPGLIALAGGGALLLFLGAASVSSTVARPVTKAIGWPVGRLYGAPGRLARENAGRAPRRTSATASALMIGVALVSASAVFASSLRDTFKRAMEQGVTADYIITSGFAGLPTELGARLAEIPELSAVTGVRGALARVDGDTKALGAADATALPELLDIGITEGEMAGLAEGVLVHEDPAEDLDLQVGDTVTLQFQNGEMRDLPVGAVYEEATLAGNWLISIDTLDSVVGGQQTDFFVAVKVADDASTAAALEAINAVLADYPQAELQTQSEFTRDQAAQIDQLLVVITVLLGLSIIIAVLGISITLGLAVFERTREIGLMRAVGMTKRQTRRMVRWEAIIVSTFGAVIGIVIGTVLGVALSVAVPPTIVDGVSFNPTIIVIILVGAVLAGLVAALYPSYKASNMDVLQAIATE